MNAAPPVIPPIDLDSIPSAVQPSVRALLQLVDALIAENQLLRGKVDQLVRKYFGGKKNESIPLEHLQLLLQGFTQEFLAAAPDSGNKKDKGTGTPPPRKPRTSARQGVPENLPVRSTQVLVPAEVKAEPDQFREIDRDTTRILDYEPGRFVCDEIVRPRFVRKEPVTASDATSLAKAEEPEVLAAPLPNRLIEKGLPGTGLLVHLVIQRFDVHVPFYRLEKGFVERHGLHLSRQTMVGWIEQLAEWMTPIGELIKKEILESGYLQVDETPIRYLDRDDPGQSKLGYFWVYHRPGEDVVFDWQTGRGRDFPKAFLEGYRGNLQCDGYGVYRSLGAETPEWKLHFCVAHWRRKFIEAKDEDRRAGWFLLQLRHLYALERRLRDQHAGPKLREAMRASEAKPIWQRMKKALGLWKQKVLPQSRMGRALLYGEELWDGLERYVSNGQIDIDNNKVENCIRPTAVGKKSFLFIGHPDAGWRSALMYTIIGSCRQRGINPELYLSDVLTRLPDMKNTELKDYTPGAWIQRHPEARIQLIR